MTSLSQRTAIFYGIILVLGVVLGVTLSGCEKVAPEEKAFDADKAAKAILQNPAFQTELPQLKSESGDVKRRAIPFKDYESRTIDPSSYKLGEPVAKAISILIKCGVVIGVCLLILFFASEWIAPKGVSPTERAERSGHKRKRSVMIDANAARDLLTEADRLAATGAFAEAVHLILLRTIDDLRTSINPDMAPSLTARELIDQSPLSQDARDTFRFLVSAAEICHFGGRAANDDLFRNCRDAYARLAFGTAKA